MPNSYNDQSLEYSDIVLQITIILRCIFLLRHQLFSFYRFIDAGSLKQETKRLALLFTAEINHVPTIDSANCGKLVKGNSDDQKGSLETNAYVEDILDDLLSARTFPSIPRVYKVKLPDASEQNGHCRPQSRPKLAASEKAVFNANRSLQCSNLSYCARFDIASVTKWLTLIELNLNLIQSSIAKPPLSDSNNCLDDETNNIPAIHVLKVKRLVNKVCDASERINGRRHIERILMNLRRRSATKELIYLIDQERLKKTRWKR